MAGVSIPPSPPVSLLAASLIVRVPPSYLWLLLYFAAGEQCISRPTAQRRWKPFQ